MMSPASPELPDFDEAPAPSKRPPAWLVTVVAGAAGAALVAAGGLVFLAARGPQRGSIVVAPTPATASITVDHVARGSGMVSLTLPPGPHEVSIEAKGYAPFKKIVQLQPGGQQLVDPTLTAEAAKP